MSDDFAPPGNPVEGYSFEDFERWLGTSETATGAANGHRPPPAPGRTRVTSGGDLERVVSGCDFIRWARDHQAAVSEPLWYAMVSNVARLDGGREAAHAFSKDHPGYSARETDAKLDHALRGSAPITCARIRELGFTGCPAEGHGVASPAALGLPRAEPEPEAPGEPASGPQTAGQAAKMLRGAQITSAVVGAPDWVVDRMFSAGHQHMLVAASQGAKTWSLFALATAIAAPSVAGFLGQRIVRHGPAVIESWEQGQAEDLRKLQKLVAGYGLGAAPDDLILLSDAPDSLSTPAYFARRLRDARSFL